MTVELLETPARGPDGIDLGRPDIADQFKADYDSYVAQVRPLIWVSESHPQARETTQAFAAGADGESA